MIGQQSKRGQAIFKRIVIMNLCALAATVSLLMVFGTVGSLDNGIMDFRTSIIVGSLSLLGFFIFTQLTITLDYKGAVEHEERKKECQWVQRPNSVQRNGTYIKGTESRPQRRGIYKSGQEVKQSL